MESIEGPGDSFTVELYINEKYVHKYKGIEEVRCDNNNGLITLEFNSQRKNYKICGKNITYIQYTEY